MYFQLSERDGDYVARQRPNPDVMWRALRAMLNRMRNELWGYFGISAVVTGIYPSLQLQVTGNAAPAIAVARAQVEQGVRSRLPGASEAVVRAELAESLRRWNLARDRLNDLLGFRRPTEVWTYSATVQAEQHTLLSWETHINYVGYTSFVVNPFSFFLGDGESAMRYTSERARASNSATLHLLHEGGHYYGTPLVSNGGSSNFGEDCNAIARDIDLAVRDHVGIAQRGQALGAPGRRVYVDSGSPMEASLGAPPLPNSQYVEWPYIYQLWTGNR